MRRVQERGLRFETHQICEGTRFYKWAIDECLRNTNLYNKTLFILRNAFTENFDKIPEYVDLIKNNRFISAYSIIGRMRAIKEPTFIAMLKSQEAALTVKRCCQAFSGWFSKLKSWKKNPQKFTGKPRMPQFKKAAGGDKLFSVKIPYQAASILPNGKVSIAGKRNSKKFIVPVRTKLKNFQELQFVPKNGCIEVQIVYRIQPKQIDLDYNKAIGIDLGVNNLMSVTSNDGAISCIVNGRPLKSINQYYNKKRAELKSKLATRGLDTSKKLRALTRKRNNKVKDYMHKASRRIVDIMKNNKIGNCFIGYNNGWKIKTNIGRRNNQNFVSIPFYYLVWLLTYKSIECGIHVENLTESYTSKCSFLDNESIEHHDEYVGKRKKRGLFISVSGKMLNADINGSANILRKGLGTTFNIYNKLFNPNRLDIEMKHPMSIIDQDVEDIVGISNTLVYN